MSITLMSAAFAAPVNATQKIVLLALCDCANDHGECYPSVQKLQEKTSLKERAIQAAMTALEDGGHMRREFRTGRSTVYWMTPQPPHHMHPRTTCTPARGAPTPAPHAPPPPHHMHPTPARGAPITIIETSIEPSPKQKAIQAATPPAHICAADMAADGVDAQHAADWLAVRKAKRLPLTQTAWCETKAEAAKAGVSVAEAVRMAAAHGWGGFRASWLSGKDAPRGGSVRPLNRQLAVEAENRRVLGEWLQEQPQ